MTFKILIIDDNIYNENKYVSRLPAFLKKAGYEVVTTSDGDDAYTLFEQCSPDLVLLDIELGGTVDGVEICRSIRLLPPKEGGNVPIILISAVMKETENILRGLEARADDYVTLPRDIREIEARIKANLPRHREIIDKYLRIDFWIERVEVKEAEAWREVNLTPLEYGLLEYLAINAGITLSNDTIKIRVFGRDDVSDNLLLAYIFRVRQKVEPNPSEPKYIQNIRGVGYRFNDLSGTQISRSRSSRKRCWG